LLWAPSGFKILEAGRSRKVENLEGIEKQKLLVSDCIALIVNNTTSKQNRCEKATREKKHH
jgi:hypothetical protein